MHKCPSCSGVLMGVEEGYPIAYLCVRCGLDFTEEEFQMELGEDDIFDTEVL